MRSSLICLFINLFVCLVAVAQTITPVMHPGKTSVNAKSPVMFSPAAISFADSTTEAVRPYAPYTILASNYYTSTLGYFCRKELALEKAVRFPVRVRLGSVAYTDQMEGKGTAVLRADGKR